MDQNGDAQAGGDAGAAPLRVAIVGAGPGGFYAAASCSRPPSRVRGRHASSACPRRGASCAPASRPTTRRSSRSRASTRRPPRTRASASSATSSSATHVSREDLLEHYHAVVYAIGTPTDNRLGIPGEDLPGSHAATEFVAWYNGHPDHTDQEVDLSAERAVVIGNGNVAIDVARMLVLDARRARADRHRRPRARGARAPRVQGGRRARPPRARRRPRSPTPSCCELGELDAGRHRRRARRRASSTRSAPRGWPSRTGPTAAQRRDPAASTPRAAAAASRARSCCASCASPVELARRRGGPRARRAGRAQRDRRRATTARCRARPPASRGAARPARLPLDRLPRRAAARRPVRRAPRR